MLNCAVVSSRRPFPTRSHTASTLGRVLPLTRPFQRGLIVLLCALAIDFLSAAQAHAQAPGGRGQPIPAPPLDGGIEWLNTDHPIKLEELKGKVVLLDFWTYCCINCMHILPDLKYLEHKYPNELVVIGVHSAKFENEKVSDNIRQAILRYEIEHPVVNDANMTIWQRYETSSWPTLVVIDPEGNLFGITRGEGKRELLDNVLGRLIEEHRTKGTLNETPLEFQLERAKQARSPLRYPGKIVADWNGSRLFVSDSNHNRIVVTTPAGQLLDVIGSGMQGSADGGFAEAQFHHPQGMVLVGEQLYVADTENHLLRVVDLQNKSVTTLAGTGTQAQGREFGGPLKQTALNSPWDLTVLDGVLYIAMAGPHQLWAHVLGTDEIGVFAGNGAEDIQDGLLQESALAQPSGICHDGSSLYFVDSEGSAVRRVTLVAGPKPPRRGKVETLAGTSNLPRGRSLFEFGDIDGRGKKARLQHPLGIVWHDGSLLVADTYNHKVKQVDVKTLECKTFLGTGERGTSLDPLQLSEPAGLTIVGETLFLADTNNHRILKIDLSTKAVEELTIEGLAPPERTDPLTSPAASATTPEPAPSN